MNLKVCRVCKEEKILTEFKKDYKKNKKQEIRYTNVCKKCDYQSNKDWVANNRIYSNNKVRERRAIRKLKGIEYKGGVCEHCKQTYHFSAFDFHHINPDEKEKDPCLLLTHTDEAFFKELDKCILLCANCHRIHHYVTNTK